LTVVGFHATGMSDRAMEAMILPKVFSGVIDLRRAVWANTSMGS
jgi:uncharacterized protein (UPF0261 family)